MSICKCGHDKTEYTSEGCMNRSKQGDYRDHLGYCVYTDFDNDIQNNI